MDPLGGWLELPVILLTEGDVGLAEVKCLGFLSSQCRGFLWESLQLFPTQPVLFAGTHVPLLYGTVWSWLCMSVQHRNEPQERFCARDIRGASILQRVPQCPRLGRYPL